MEKYHEITIKSDEKTVRDWLVANVGGWWYIDKKRTRINLHRSVTNQGDIEVNATIMFTDDSGKRQIERLGKCFYFKLIEVSKRITKLRIEFIQDELYLSNLSNLIVKLEDRFQLEEEEEPEEKEPTREKPEPTKKMYSDTAKKLEKLREIRERSKAGGTIIKKYAACGLAEIDPKTVKRHDPELWSNWYDPDY